MFILYRESGANYCGKTIAKATTSFFSFCDLSEYRNVIVVSFMNFHEEFLFYKKMHLCDLSLVPVQTLVV